MRTIAHRRALETRVIDVARAIARSDGMFADIEGLRIAVMELDEAGLADPTNARSRGWPVTSVQAAAWMKGNFAGSVVAKIVGRLRRGSRTVEEICFEINGKHQTVSARVNELRDAGWVRDSGRTHATSSGMQATVWTLTDEAWARINAAKEERHGRD